MPHSFLKNVFSKYSFSFTFPSIFLFQTLSAKFILGEGKREKWEKAEEMVSGAEKAREVNPERFSRPSLGPLRKAD